MLSLLSNQQEEFRRTPFYTAEGRDKGIDMGIHGARWAALVWRQSRNPGQVSGKHNLSHSNRVSSLGMASDKITSLCNRKASLCHFAAFGELWKSGIEVRLNIYPSLTGKHWSLFVDGSNILCWFTELSFMSWRTESEELITVGLCFDVQKVLNCDILTQCSRPLSTSTEKWPSFKVCYIAWGYESIKVIKQKCCHIYSNQMLSFLP